MLTIEQFRCEGRYCLSALSAWQLSKTGERWVLESTARVILTALPSTTFQPPTAHLLVLVLPSRAYLSDIVMAHFETLFWDTTIPQSISTIYLVNLKSGTVNSQMALFTYGLPSGGKWKTRMTAQANGPTSIMLSSHVFWLVLTGRWANYYHILNFVEQITKIWMPSKYFLQLNALQYIPTDLILIPTEKLKLVKDPPLDFIEPAEIRLSGFVARALPNM
ncbi:hypothetical protein MJO28_011633 [Puccinia striiformis f. sp. tritici]|uniref:Uncharacterized protein n=1 Tax=Puccinia striiformis f. sp. tritici TaxID=168172 RepID=A0ACC0E365_9BASI|nr:hypothetical protein MJO28_011633 [Puccinia striiformis f. sp. tritici]